MQVKFLKSIVEELINKPAAPIVDLLVGKKDVNEFLIAKKLNLTINQTRNILYKLSDYGLVSFIRKKDKRKGWYIYFWTLNVHQALNLLEKKLKEELEQLNSQLKNRKEKRHYLCNTCSIEVTEEVALLNNFTCSECEEIYDLAESEGIVNQLQKRITKVKKEIEFVSFEREKEEEKIEKKKSKKIKKAEEERKARRKRTRKITKERKKPVKKRIKKKIKKKIIKKLKKPKKKVVKKVSKLLGKFKKKKK
jgi:transcription factor E